MYKDIKYKLNIYRRYSYWQKQGCVFIHVPKAAGTSVNKSLYGRTLGHYSATEIMRTFPNLWTHGFTFSLVRNPWDRILSAYRFSRLGHTDSMGVYRPEQYQIPEFSSFERFVYEWLPYKNLSRCDFIFRPQYLFVCDHNKKVMVDHLGNVERLAESVSFVEDQLGHAIDVTMMNRTSSPDKSYRDAYITNEMIDIVSAAYSDDINTFGYDF